MNQERTSLRLAARMMRRVPESYPLDLEIALPTVRQVELKSNMRLGTDLGFVENLV